MQRLAIIKTSDNLDLAHVYEHLFCYAIENHFIHHKLISYIDYFYDARTYPNGLVHISLHLYSKDALAHAGHIAHLEPSFDEDTVNIALLEIMAEKQMEVSGDIKELIRLLKELHKSPWLPIDEVGILDVRSSKLSPKAIKLHSVPTDNFKTMKCEIALSNENLKLPSIYAQPLFNVLAETISNNLTDMLARDYAYFGYETVNLHEESAVSFTRCYRVHQEQIDSLTTEVEDCEAMVATLLSNGLIEKTHAYLTRANFSLPLEAPDALAFYEKSELLVGGQGWRDIATTENIETVLQSMSISLSLGRTRKPVKTA